MCGIRGLFSSWQLFLSAGTPKCWTRVWCWAVATRYWFRTNFLSISDWQFGPEEKWPLYTGASKPSTTSSPPSKAKGHCNTRLTHIIILQLITSFSSRDTTSSSLHCKACLIAWQHSTDQPIEQLSLPGVLRCKSFSPIPQLPMR